MVLPLYAGIAGMRPAYGTDSNSGLWYDKFFDQYRQDWSLSKEGNEKRNWVTAICARPAGNRALLEQAGIRLSAMAYALGGEVRLFATDWRFVTGLGRDHPVENGFAWHHTLGVPFLPGSSVKGMTRAWAEAWAGADPRDIERIFGPEGEGQEKRVGSVIFFDALPAKPVKLAPDVMTPHYAPYYQQGSDQPPGDWFDPLPIPFLTVAPGQEFIFALAPRRFKEEDSHADCRMALRWLEDALATLGAGAKTAVGYGRFFRRVDREQSIRSKIEAAPTPNETILSPRHTERSVPDPAGVQAPEGSAPGDRPDSPVRAEMRLDGFDTDENRFMVALGSKWLPRLQAEDTPDSERGEIAVLLREWYLRFRSDQWSKPNKKNKEKIAVIRKYLSD